VNPKQDSSLEMFRNPAQIRYVNPLKPKLVQIILNNSARTSKTTPPFTITTINLLPLLKKIIPVYAEIPNTQIQIAVSLTGDADRTYSCLSAL
jgi:hypothetical protein